ncbi:MAG TPA: response regulator transcription factor [Saprospiraceae bacterium]|nr:response regulator transcription factor [Saprospiraceae bacterium]
MIKVIIYEDNGFRRESLVELIQSQENMLVVGAESDCRTVAEDIRGKSPELILLDLNMPYCDGFDGLKIIKCISPNTKVIVQTIHEEVDKILSCIKLGAEGYILKKEGPQKIIQSVNDVLNGGATLTPSVALEILRSISIEKSNSRNMLLSERENEVLEALAKGQSYKMIADELKISHFTVNSHLKKIYEKLHVHSATEAIRVYYK